MKTYTFMEPHITGGCATVEITEEQIITYMHSLQSCNRKEFFRGVSDEYLLDYFIVNYWCSEVKNEETKTT